jgi:methionyl-tRNA formyltransferase
LLKDKNPKASVGVHYMTERVDAGEVIIEEFVDVSGKETVVEVYNELYPYYAITLLKALKIISDER